jgi:hypothetical protein
MFGVCEFQAFLGLQSKFPCCRHGVARVSSPESRAIRLEMFQKSKSGRHREVLIRPTGGAALGCGARTGWVAPIRALTRTNGDPPFLKGRVHRGIATGDTQRLRGRSIASGNRPWAIPGCTAAAPDGRGVAKCRNGCRNGLRHATRDAFGGGLAAVGNGLDGPLQPSSSALSRPVMLIAWPGCRQSGRRKVSQWALQWIATLSCLMITGSPVPAFGQVSTAASVAKCRNGLPTVGGTAAAADGRGVAKCRNGCRNGLRHATRNAFGGGAGRSRSVDSAQRPDGRGIAKCRNERCNGLRHCRA